MCACVNVRQSTVPKEQRGGIGSAAARRRRHHFFSIINRKKAPCSALLDLDSSLNDETIGDGGGAAAALQHGDARPHPRPGNNKKTTTHVCTRMLRPRRARSTTATSLPYAMLAEVCVSLVCACAR